MKDITDTFQSKLYSFEITKSRTFICTNHFAIIAYYYGKLITPPTPPKKTQKDEKAVTTGSKSVSDLSGFLGQAGEGRSSHPVCN